MNKKIFLLAIVIAGSLQLSAQQIPLYSNYFFTPFIYNPSASGTDGSTELSLIHRRQWVDVQGSPETSALTINGSLNEEKVGWSVYAFRDITDIISRNGIYGNYAYHLRLADNTTLSFGLGAGYLNHMIDQSAIRARHDEAIISVTTDNRGKFDINAGLNLKIADFTLGLSAPQLLGSSVRYTENTSRPVSYSLLRHYVVSTRYDFRFKGEDNVLSPVIMLKAAENVPIQVDAGLIFNLKDYGYVGAMYRSEYAVTANIGLNLTEQLTVGYAYDFSLNDYGAALGASHEIMLTFRFGKDKKTERLENELKRIKHQQRSQKDEVEEIVDERLEEFKDEMRRDIKKEVGEVQANQPQTTPPANNTGTTNDNQTGNNNDRNNQQGNTANQPGGNQNQQNNNNTPVKDYSPANRAENVQPGSPGYYVVAGVFSNQQNADKLVKNLAANGLNARYFQDMNNYYYYVYLLKFDNYNQADQAKASNLNGNYSGDLWIKIIE